MTRDPAGWDVDSPVQAEVFVVWLDGDDRIQLDRAGRTAGLAPPARARPSTRSRSSTGSCGTPWGRRSSSTRRRGAATAKRSSCRSWSSSPLDSSGRWRACRRPGRARPLRGDRRAARHRHERRGRNMACATRVARRGRPGRRRDAAAGLAPGPRRLRPGTVPRPGLMEVTRWTTRPSTRTGARVAGRSAGRWTTSSTRRSTTDGGSTTWRRPASRSSPCSSVRIAASSGQRLTVSVAPRRPRAHRR